jgi:uncharacterized protein
LPRDAEIRPVHRADLFDGIVTLNASASVIDVAEFKPLYRADPPRREAGDLCALPYFLWSNRSQGSMLVWIPEQ